MIDLSVLNSFETLRGLEADPWGFDLLIWANDQDRTGDLILTMDVLYRLSYIGEMKPEGFVSCNPTDKPGLLERKTGLEPATLSLEGWCSTKWATSACIFILQFGIHHLLGLPLPELNGGERRIRTFEVVRQQIYSLSHLATLVSPRQRYKPLNCRADGGIRTPDPLITNQ